MTLLVLFLAAPTTSSTIRNSKPASISSRPRSHSRPPPITVHSCPPSTMISVTPAKSPSILGTHPPSRQTKAPIQPLDSPAFLKGDLNFSTFRERAALAIAEWGPSPTVSHFPASDPLPLTSRRINQSNVGVTLALPANHGLKVSSLSPHSTATSHLPSPPLTPLTPGPCSQPLHREQSAATRQSSLKFNRPRPSPLQLKQPKSPGQTENVCPDEMQNYRNVRFADGSPLRGSTWHITQYPARLASPPISAANLTLADLVELEAIKQSLGTWCGAFSLPFFPARIFAGEMMGSPMRGSFSQSSTCSLSESEGQKSWASPHTPLPNPEHMYSSPISWPEKFDSLWPEVKWPYSLDEDSDCDSEIYEGMH
ncbi:hypothetical protein VP01_2833g3 [Puccinia sorghi]|uniref:Uncharacterized protein n=1 Tax=Puccinia sorghi TaxID=27349 RepID=A0A0L6V308_9BASI|nr:hypothetical protein VP01_2833g3 [Puccinia sorghi]